MLQSMGSQRVRHDLATEQQHYLSNVQNSRDTSANKTRQAEYLFLRCSWSSKERNINKLK